MAELYRVRKNWNDPKSQIGAFGSLDNAKKIANQYQYNVYNSKGQLIYTGTRQGELYRIRLSWNDEKSQKGAYRDLTNAKIACEKLPGYSVFDSTGKKVYTSKTTTVTTAFDSYVFSAIGNTVDLKIKSTSPVTCYSANTAIATVTNKGIVRAIGAGTTTITVGNKTVKVTVPAKPTIKNAMKPMIAAAKNQAIYSYNSIYKWQANPTVAKSKTNGTCVTYVACVLQRLRILASGQYVWHNGSGYGNGKVTGTINSHLSIKYLNNKRPAALKTQLQLGDIVLHDDNKSGTKGNGGHIEIFAGEINSSGLAKYYTGGCGSHKNTSLNSWNKRPILAIIRPKTHTIKASCQNGAITASSLNLCMQNVTIKYSANNGKTLKSVIVDGKAVNIKTYPTSYTFKSISANHTIHVVYA